jgi:uncharacterized protein involved in exopolysaccharide biosynthesis
MMADMLSNRTQPMLSLREISRFLWRRKFPFVLLALFFGSLPIVWAFIATPQYRVAVRMMPQSDAAQSGALQSLVGQFGGLASLAGISLGGSGEEQSALALLTSRAFATRFIEQKRLMPILFAKQWDAAANRWRAGLTERQMPSIDDAWVTFDRRVRRVHQDAKTKIVTLEILWRDRQQAADWANSFVNLANYELRQRAIGEADASLEFLEAQVKKTSVVDLQQSIYRLMETQIKRKVLANSRPDYAFTVIDPAIPPDADRFDSPKRFLLLLLAVPFGVVASGMSLFSLHQLRSVTDGTLT